MDARGPFLGLDVGEVRIGVAHSDSLGILASPHSVIRTQSSGVDAAAIAALARELGVVRVVVGMPVDRMGQVGHQGQKVLRFVETLRTATDIDIVTQDERFSSAAAERVLREANMRRDKRKAAIDKVAAQQILQSYLDRLANERKRQS
jgi:putative Holliday junction resolvase